MTAEIKQGGPTLQTTQIGLLNDFGTVLNAEKKQRQVASKIYNMTATPEEIIDWSAVHDPIEEFTMFALHSFDESDNPVSSMRFTQEYSFESRLMEKAGISLIASVYFPEMYDPTDPTWIYKLTDQLHKKIPSFKNDPHMPIKPEYLVGFARLRAPSIQVSQHDLEKLSIAADLFRTLSFRVDYSSTDQEREQNLLNSGLNKKLLYLQNNIVSRTTSSNICRLIMESVTKESTFETQLLKLDAQASCIATLRSLPIAYSSLTPELYSLVCNTAHVFKNYQQNKEGINKAELRGRLHELLWLLDATILLQMKNIVSIFVLPAASSQDTPRIDHPEFNRSFDMVIENTKTGGVGFIQLKSRPNPHFEQSYHSLIHVIHEQNFMDNEPRRLAAKLDIYKRFLESGMPSDQHAQIMRRWMLRSVPETLLNPEFIQKPLLDRHAEIFGIETKPTPKETRQQRRARERRIQKAMGIRNRGKK